MKIKEEKTMYPTRPNTEISWEVSVVYSWKAVKIYILFVLLSSWGATSQPAPSSLLSWKMISPWIPWFLLSIMFGDLFRFRISFLFPVHFFIAISVRKSWSVVCPTSSTGNAMSLWLRITPLATTLFTCLFVVRSTSLLGGAILKSQSSIFFKANCTLRIKA